jgi:hypothetical protein
MPSSNLRRETSSGHLVAVITTSATEGTMNASDSN